MRILVTGVTGFAGGFLAEDLLAQGAQVAGVSRAGRWPRACAHLAGKVDLHACDLGTGPAIEAVLRQVQPEQIYHLAGYAHVGRSFEQADAAWAGNLQATRNLYEAVRNWGGQPRILFVGSGLVYGGGRGAEEIQDEKAELRPDSPYAASKAAADLASYQYTCHPGLDIVRVRPFNHVGPRQSPEYALPHFAQQLVAIERGQRARVLETGNLSSYRDLTDVRDVVAAYQLLMARGRTGAAYNVASGRTQTMRAVLDRLLALGNVAVEVRQRSDLLRSTDPTVVRVDASRLRQETGWTPRYSLDQTLADTLAYWREQP
jgi:GDP-4-dehydro-6-deoxy-D-mannose reductase